MSGEHSQCREVCLSRLSMSRLCLSRLCLVEAKIHLSRHICPPTRWCTLVSLVSGVDSPRLLKSYAMCGSGTNSTPICVLVWKIPPHASLSIAAGVECPFQTIRFKATLETGPASSGGRKPTNWNYCSVIFSAVRDQSRPCY